MSGTNPESPLNIPDSIKDIPIVLDSGSPPSLAKFFQLTLTASKFSMSNEHYLYTHQKFSEKYPNNYLHITHFCVLIIFLLELSNIWAFSCCMFCSSREFTSAERWQQKSLAIKTKLESRSDNLVSLPSIKRLTSGRLPSSTMRTRHWGQLPKRPSFLVPVLWVSGFNVGLLSASSSMVELLSRFTTWPSMSPNLPIPSSSSS